MRNGICPKCGTASVFIKKRGTGFGAGVHVDTGGMMKVTSEFTSYVCTTCGYFENYITDEGKLRQVMEKWDQVPPSKS